MANTLRPTRPTRASTVQRAAVVTAIVAVLPYAVFKLLWLSGSTAGMTAGADEGGMLAPRYLIGNVLTLVMVVAAVAFIVSVTRPWALRIPWFVVFVLGAGAAGLLAPILLGLPPGLLIQAVVEGGVKPTDEVLTPWVFGLVYTGFCVLGAAMAVVVGAYALRRWGDLLTVPPSAPPRWAVICGLLGMLPFCTAMAYWAMAGPGDTGPQGMDQPGQRMVVGMTAVLGIIAFLVPLTASRLGRIPQMAWLAVWTGCCVVAVQGPTQILLAQDAQFQPLIAIVALLATPGASLYGLAVLRDHLRSKSPSRPRP